MPKESAKTDLCRLRRRPRRAFRYHQGLRNRLTINDPRILNKVGAFASLFEASFPGISDPVLVLKAEEPGSKQLLAKQSNKIENIGYDMINHLINDIIVMGGKPLAVLDVIVWVN